MGLRNSSALHTSQPLGIEFLRVSRCDTLPHARYVYAVEADNFSVVLDYALNNFSTAL